MDSWWNALKRVTSGLLSIVVLKLTVSVWREWGAPSAPATILAILRAHISAVSWIVALSISCAILWLLAAREETLEKLKSVTFFKPSRDLDPKHMSLTGFHPYFQSSPEAAKAQQELSTKGQVLILGRPAGGKTRLAYCLAKENEPYLVLRLQPDFNKSESLVFSRIPPRCKVLWIVDDLDKFAVGKLDLVHLVDVLKRQCDLRIIITCREGQELDRVRANNELAAFIEPLLPGISCPNFSQAELLLLAEKTGMPLDPSGYDGTPGSVTLGLEKMRQRLHAATSEAKALMKAMFLLRTALIYQPSEQLAIAVFSEIYRIEPAEEKVEAAVLALKRDGFLLETLKDQSDDQSLLPAHDCYLTPEFFRHYPTGGDQLQQHLLALGKTVDNHGTPADCKSIGMFWSAKNEFARALPYLQKAAAQDSKDAILGLGLGVALYKIGRFTEAVDVFRRVVAFNPYYLEALCNLALLQPVAGIPAQEALPTFDKLVSLYNIYRVSGDPPLEVRRSVAGALVLKGEVLHSLGRDEDAVQAYDAVVNRFGASTDLSMPIVDALLGKGVALRHLSRHDESIKAWDEALSRSKGVAGMEMRRRFAKAAVSKGVCLMSLGRNAEAVTALTDVTQYFRSDDDPILRALFAKALIQKGFALSDLDRNEEAIPYYDEVLHYFDSAKEDTLRVYVARAIVQKAFAQSKLSRNQEAIRSCDEVLRRFDSATEVALRRYVAKAMLEKAVFLVELNRESEAMSVLQDIVRCFGGSTDSGLKGYAQIAESCVALGAQGNLKLGAGFAKISFSLDEG